MRFYSEANNGSPKRSWMMRKDQVVDANGNLLSAAEIKDRFAVPHLPDRMVELTVPANTKMLVGKANEIPKWESGGGEQYYSIDFVKDSWYDPSEIIEVL